MSYLILTHQQSYLIYLTVVMKIVLMCLFVFVSFCQRSPDQFTINLDLPPRQRYRELALTKRASITQFIDFLHTDRKYKIAFRIAKYGMTELKGLIQQEFYQQCQGIAKAINKHISELIVFNYMYELGAYSKFCTSIAVQVNNSDYFLARNLDYGFQQYLANNSVKLTYIKNSIPIFQTIGHAGMIGAHTGLRFNGYSITLNERIDLGLHRTLEQILLKRSQNVPYLMQKTLRNASTIEQAYEKLLNSRVCAAVYFIINGPHRNILIQKERVGAKGVFTNTHYIVQTNTDVQMPDPDTRRDVAEKKMEQILESNKIITRESVWGILTAPPNMNKLTLISVILDTKNNRINATVWA